MPGLTKGAVQRLDLDYIKINGVKFDGNGGARKIKKIPFGATELGGVETNTSFVFPENGAFAVAAWIYVNDAESGTMDVGTQGTSNDPDGLLDGISLASTGYVYPQVTYSNGTNEHYLSACTFGALTHNLLLGSDVAAGSGHIVPRPTFITGLDPVSITSSGDLNSCDGYLFIEYIELPPAALV